MAQSGDVPVLPANVLDRAAAYAQIAISKLNRSLVSIGDKPIGDDEQINVSVYVPRLKTPGACLGHSHPGIDWNALGLDGPPEEPEEEETSP